MHPASVWLALSLFLLHQALGQVDKHQMVVYRSGTIAKVTIETLPQSTVVENGGKCKCNSRRMNKFRNQYGGSRCTCESTHRRRDYARLEDLEKEFARREDEEEMDEIEAKIEARERKDEQKERRMKTINRIQIRIK
ncbi:hypothetical protein ECG_00293 [Echinococcus granulosus]|uniref:Expressed conserved protein n=1 Tax=Echinococcus granulosus TaxID=6210 RepID=A0A068WQZ0_ECHGR|nr:hypothetical protein ECG_00293 [Echinococcus granulosus]CDS22553.1 expressed conserved protein [Echinococcus granulosus]